MKTLLYDNELDNAMLFGQYVMVMSEGKLIGGGMIEAYHETEIQVGSRWHSRNKLTFVVSPAPEAFIAF